MKNAHEDTSTRWRPTVSRPLAAVSIAAIVLVVFAVAGAGAASTDEAAAMPPSNASVPTVTGTAREGSTLTAATGDWDGDTPLTYTYQWQRCDGNGDSCSPLPGATAQTQMLTSSDVGRTVRVAVTATNAAGSATSLSPARGVVSPAGNGPASSAPPTLTGTVQQGQTLTASSGSWNGSSPITFAYQWQRCNADGGSCVDIAGATGQTRTLGANDVSQTVRAAVTATNTAGSGKAYSEPTVAVAGANAPVNTTPPAISGTARQGEALTVSSGSWNGTQPITFAYQWKRCDANGAACSVITGATGQTYVPGASDLGFTLRVSVTASNGAGSSSTLTGPSGVVAAPGTAPANTTPPVISGATAPGSTLTLNPGGWSGATPISYTYAWQRCDSNGNNCVWIAEATSQTYRLTAADVDHRFRGQVGASNSVGSSGAYSGLTAVVAARDPINTAPPTISGSAELGHTLTAARGSWVGATPISYTYQWARSNAQGGYVPISGAKNTTYVLASADVRHRLIVQVKAANQYGAAFVNSATTAVVSNTKTPANTALPTIAGAPQVGATLTLTSAGTWSTPTPLAAVTQNWVRCDSAGNGCGVISGATAKSYKVTTADQGHTIRVVVTATSAAGATSASSKQTGVVGGQSNGVPAGLPAGAIRLPSGQYSIPVSSVSLPTRLVISGVSFTPTVVRARAQFIARFRITDTRGYAVRGALVYPLGLPYRWVKSVREQASGTDGWVTFQMVPTAKLPLKRGSALVVFVRARKPGGDLLAGVSTRRLVQVLLGRHLP